MDRHDTFFLRNFQPFCIKCHTENHGRRFGGNICKTTDTRKCSRAAVRIDISMAVNFQCSHKTNIQATVIIQVKLVCHIINRRGSDHRSECLSRNRKTADSTGFHGQRDHVQHPTLSRISGNRLRNPDSNVYNIIHTQFPGCPFSDNVRRNVIFALFLGKLMNFLIPCMPFFVRDLKTSGQCRVRFISLFRLCHNDCIDQTARNDGITRAGRCIYQPVYLYDHFSTVRLDCLTDR